MQIELIAAKESTLHCGIAVTISSSVLRLEKVISWSGEKNFSSKMVCLFSFMYHQPLAVIHDIVTLNDGFHLEKPHKRFESVAVSKR